MTAPLNGETVSLALPIQGYEGVVRLVIAGFASRLEFGFETVDDLQLAIELVLRSLPERESTTTVVLSSDDEWLTVVVAPAQGLSLEQPLRALDGAGISLGASLERLVDSAQLDQVQLDPNQLEHSEAASSAVVLRKRRPEVA